MVSASVWGLGALLILMQADPGRTFEFQQVFSFRADEASQAVAVDGEHLFAIASARIGKYDRTSHRRVAQWKSSSEKPLVHLNSGVVLGGKLYCAHSNYPRIPMESSVEIWDAATLEHVRSVPLENAPGSLTWVDRKQGEWWLCFAQYDGNGGDEGKDHTDTVLARCDESFRILQQWKFPAKVLDRFKPNSCSGGVWGPRNLLLCTGHDHAEVYFVELPTGAEADRLQWVATGNCPIQGQGIAWESETGMFFGVRRGSREIVGCRLVVR
jgi:hypothetical protein